MTETITWVVPALATAFDPRQSQGSAATIPFAYQFGSTLTATDPSSLPGAGCDALNTPDKIRGELAESWEYSADGKSITVHLRHGVKSAAGNELTSEDVRWSNERTLFFGGTGTFLLYSAANYAGAGTGGAKPSISELMSVVDKYTVKYNLVSRTSIDMAVWSHWSERIIDSTEAKKHATEDDPWASKWLETNLASFGPWTFDSADFQPGERLTLRANQNYWNADKRGNIGTVQIVRVPDDGTRAQTLQRGEADIAAALSFEQYASLEGKPGVSVKNCIGATRDLLMLNFKDPRFSDVRVRQAISRALDRDAIVQGSFSGFADPAISGVARGYLTNPTVQENYKHDVASAKALLAAAGYPNGFTFKLLYSTADPGPWTQQLAIFIQSQLKDVGITVELDLAPTGPAYSERRNSKEAEAWLYGQNPAIPSIYYSMLQLNKSNSSLNYHSYANPAYDALLQRLAESTDAEEAALISQANDLVATELPEIAIAERRNMSAVTSKFTAWNNVAGRDTGEIQTFVKASS